uniref:Granulins domain-containing protein n=1 Tax=Vitrella brassicaformis TaxID=1169539 RepID=A0A7S1KGW9_9ALVE|mmetsp:Transcript_54103/g.136142  ORF Transcript_54103/g.136142 Transcript_54103/m.136142 type:complete len:124 (+) Transcript_54103:168-539(+)
MKIVMCLVGALLLAAAVCGAMTDATAPSDAATNVMVLRGSVSASADDVDMDNAHDAEAEAERRELQMYCSPGMCFPPPCCLSSLPSVSRYCPDSMCNRPRHPCCVRQWPGSQAAWSQARRRPY